MHFYHCQVALVVVSESVGKSRVSQYHLNKLQIRLGVWMATSDHLSQLKYHWKQTDSFSLAKQNIYTEQHMSNKPASAAFAN